MLSHNAGVDTMAEVVAALANDRSGGIRTTEGESWTWAEVVAEGDARAGALPRHVGVLLDNVPEYVFTLVGAALAGTVVVGINPTRRGEELARDIRHTDCDLVLTDEAHLPLLDGLDLGGAPINLIGSGGEIGTPTRRSLHQNGVEADDLYLLLFTSGSTGAPKAVRMSQGRAAGTAAASAVAFTPDDVLYCSMPLFHGNALLANLFPGMISGATVVLRPRFSASAFLPDVRRFGCTYFNYIGRTLSYILATPPAPDDADNTLKWALGSEASPEDQRRFRKRFGCPLFEGYGSSEGAVVIQPTVDTPKGALGRPKAGTDVAVVDPATGVECQPGEVGEIVRRDGAPDFEGYYGNPEAEAERTRNGWYWSGDLGWQDHDGIFWFAGRSADWLRVDGENFAAGPVERIIGRFPGVRAVAVYGVPDPVTGDQVMAAVETDDLDPAAFAAFLAEQEDLGTKWAPRFVRLCAALPTTATGKTDKQPLRREAWRTTDPVWWRPAGEPDYRRLTPDDDTALAEAFAAAGRAPTLPTWP